MDSFQEWLSTWLRGLKTDEAVFGPYITSILDEDDEEEDKIEALDGLLQELAKGNNVTALRTEIISRWERSRSEASGSGSGNNPSSSSGDPGQGNGDTPGALGDQLDEILRIASESVAKSGNQQSKSKDVPDKQLRDAILSNLSESSDEEDPAEPSPGPSSSSGATGKKKSDSLLADYGRNVNVEKVMTEQREGRDKAKAEHAVKKERDKEDRAKQKQKAADRKEQAKKKATKVERKR